jgi:hypothetical protein
MKDEFSPKDASIMIFMPDYIKIVPVGNDTTITTILVFVVHILFGSEAQRQM